VIRRSLILLACASVLVITGPAEAGQSGLHLRRIAGASSPVNLTSPASEPDNLYVVEQRGVVRVIVAGRMRARPFLDLSSRVKSGGEQGLLSLAFDPRYARNHRFYVDYTDVNGNTRVVRFRSNGTRAILSSAKLLLFVRQPYANHNGGQLQFGPDGKLYVGMGDGGSGGDPQNRAQNLGIRLGKLLRANVGAKRIRWSIAGYGLRNPWRFSFDRTSGNLYIGDVGQDSWEEIDFLPRGRLPKLINYGWSVYEGTHSFKPSEPLNRRGALVWPIHEYGHVSGNCSVTGGYVYRGSAQPALRGRYFFGDYCSGTIWSLKVKAGKAVSIRREPIHVPALSSFGQDAAGELYALSLNGPIYRIT
jgi:glucose/arabinose dehydrogenase